MKKLIFWVLIMMFSIVYFSQTPTELIINGGFEQSKSLYPWVVETTKGGVLVSGPNENGNPHGGNRYVTLGGTTKEKDSIYQSVIVPANIEFLQLSFALKVKPTGNDKNPHDYLRVFLKGEAIDVEIAEFSNLNKTDWRIVTIESLQTCASGGLVNVLFEVTTDGTKPTKFMIDDVSLKYTPSANTPTTPNFEFISPRFGCIYPSLDYQTITGAQPLTLLAYAPNGIQTFYVEIDGQIVATTDQTTLQVPLNWSFLSPGEHTLQGTLVDRNGLVIVKKCAIPSTNILEGADFESYNIWSESSTSDLSLVKEVDSTEAYDGIGVALLGGGKGTTDVLEQIIWFPEDSEDTVTLSFFCNTPINSSITKTSLQIQLADAETDAIYAIGNIGSTSSGWTLVRMPFSLSEKGLQKDYPYWLQFKVVAQNSDTLLTPFYIDDVALYVYSATLAAGTSGDPSDIPGREETSSSPGLQPTISSIDRHYGKKEGGDPMNIYGSGFDPDNITVKFRRILSGTLSYGNWVKREKMADKQYQITYHDPLNSAWIYDVNNTQIILDKDHPKDVIYHPTDTCTGAYGCGTPSSYDNKFGKVRIVVKNGNGNATGFGWQNGLGFRYGYPPPHLYSVSPNQLSIVGGESEGKFDLYGDNFVKGATVKVGEINCAVTFVDSTHLTAMLPFWKALCCSNTCLGQVGSPRTVTVTNPDNISSSLEQALTLLPGPSPTIASFSPTRGTYQGGTLVTVTGQNFSRVSSIKVGSDYADCTKATINESRTQLTFTTPPSCNGPITVYTQDGTFGASSTNFHYDDPSRPLTFYSSSPDLNYPIYCKDQDITLFYNGGPQCDGIDRAKSTASIEPGDPTNKSRMSVSIKDVSNTDNSRNLKLTLTKIQCPDAGVQERHILTVTAVTLTGVTANRTFDVWVASPPTEQLSTSITTTISSMTVSFQSNVSGGTAPYTYQWNFGDGTTSTLASPSHTYSTAGTYSVTLTVKDSSSPQQSATSSISVTVGSSTTLSVSASASPYSAPSAPVTVQFTSSASGGNPPYSYYWTFGDGGTSTLQNPSHTYQSKGIYTVTIKVTDSHNQTATKSLNIKIGAISPL